MNKSPRLNPGNSHANPNDKLHLSSSTMKPKPLVQQVLLPSVSPEISEPLLNDDIEDEASVPQLAKAKQDNVSDSESPHKQSVDDAQKEEQSSLFNNPSGSDDENPTATHNPQVQPADAQSSRILLETSESHLQEGTEEPQPQEGSDPSSSGMKQHTEDSESQTAALKIIQPPMDKQKSGKLTQSRAMDIENALNGQPFAAGSVQTPSDRSQRNQIMFLKKYVLEQRCLDWIQPYDDVAEELRNLTISMAKITFDTELYKRSKSILLHNTKVFFPHEPHKGQLLMMENIMSAIESSQNAIMEMPSGSGKSIALLNCALGWLQSRQDLRKNLDTKIVYVAKNHASCDQLTSLLKESCYRPIVTVIGNRDPYCINEDLSKIYGSEKSGRCMKMVRCGDCRYYTGLDSNRKQTKKLVFEAMAHTVEDLNELGRKHGFCPYYYSKNLANEAHVIIMTHGFLSFYGLRETIRDYLRGAIVIVDDAQGIIQSTEEGEGAKISVRDLNQANKELSKIISELKGAQNQSNTQFHRVLRASQEVLQTVSGFKAEIESRFQTNHKKDVMQPGKEIFDVLHKVLGSKHPLGHYQGLKTLPQDIRTHLETVSEIVELIYNERELGALSFSVIIKWALFLERVLDLLENFIKHEYTADGWKRQTLSHFEFVIENKWFFKSQSLMVDIKCLSSHLAFRDVQNCGPRSILFAGHTLAPFEPVIVETMIPFHKQFFWPAHVVSVEKQFFGTIVTRLGSDLELKFDYNSRGDMRMNERIGELVEKVVKLGDKSILIYFTNVVSLRTCYEAWYQLGLVNRVKEHKRIIRENDMEINLKKELTQLKERFLAFQHAKLSQTGVSMEAPQPVVLLATHSGRIADELEKFPGLVQVVIMMGAPYCSTSTAAIAPKKKYMDRMCVLEPEVSVGKGTNAIIYKRIQGSQWYDKVYSKATNIVINTAVQGRYDSTAILFLDHRFEWKKNKGEMPLWCRKKLKNHYDCDSIISSLRNFFTESEEFVHKLRDLDHNRKDQPWRVPRIAQPKGKKKGPQEIIDFDLEKIDQELDDINEEDLKRMEMGLNRVEPIDHMKMLKQNLKEAKVFSAALKKAKFADPSHDRRTRRVAPRYLMEDDGFIINEERSRNSIKGRSVPLAKYYGKGPNKSEDEEESQREDSINQNYTKMRDALRYEQVLKKRGIATSKNHGSKSEYDALPNTLGKRKQGRPGLHRSDLYEWESPFNSRLSNKFGSQDNSPHLSQIENDPKLQFTIPNTPLSPAEMDLYHEFKSRRQGKKINFAALQQKLGDVQMSRESNTASNVDRPQHSPDELEHQEDSVRSSTAENYARRSAKSRLVNGTSSPGLSEATAKPTKIDDELARLKAYIRQAPTKN